MDISNNELTISMNNLNLKINNLLDIFRVADEEMKKPSAITLDSLNLKLDKVIDQHEKIADAIVAITEMVQGKERTAIKPVIPSRIPPPQQVNLPNMQSSQQMPRPDLPPQMPNIPPSLPKMNVSSSGQLKPLSLSSSRPTLKPLGRPPKRP